MRMRKDIFYARRNMRGFEAFIHFLLPSFARITPGFAVAVFVGLGSRGLGAYVLAHHQNDG